ncbi:MAG TPA: hypothetical protein VGX71_04920 [Pseudaminobacter sp.]|nr:hypothetical protein [Pseudaminobacter sp.]
MTVLELTKEFVNAGAPSRGTQHHRQPGRFCAVGAIDRANAILTDQGSDLATAARNGSEAQIGETAQALGQAIVDALL